MNISTWTSELGIPAQVPSPAADWPDRGAMLRAGVLGGLAGAVTIWIYEAVVWVGLQNLMPLAGIRRNATGLVFGKSVQDRFGAGSYVIGTGIHFVFAMAWGVLFAAIWSALRHRGWEATLAAMFYAVTAWIIRHVAIAAAFSNHPKNVDPNGVIGGFMSHLFFKVPLALSVERRCEQVARG